MNKERNSNFELLRIVSMLFIVLGHVIMHGNIKGNTLNPSMMVIFDILSMVVLVHVNSYILVTGYFQSKTTFKQSKLWSIIAECLFYRIAVVAVFSIFDIKDFSVIEICKAIFPLNIGEYWFIGNYLMLYCISPFLNKFIDNISKKEHQTALIVLTVLFSIIPYLTGNSAIDNSGYTLYNFIYLYLIGAYLRRYPIEESYLFKRCSKQLLRVIFAFIFIMCVVMNYCIYTTANSLVSSNTIFKHFAEWLLGMTGAYSNPIIIIQTIFYFAYFSTFKIKSKFINRVSALTLGVYLIHDNSHVRSFIYKWLKIDRPAITSYKFIIYTLAIALGIFVACLIIEWFRQLLFKLIGKLKISKLIKEKYYSFVSSISIKPAEEQNQEAV